MSEYDVVIVGAGAAGLMAAIAAGGRGARILLLDSQRKIGAKILVAGGGRCNVTNEFVAPSRFHTESDPALLDNSSASTLKAGNANAKNANAKNNARSFVGRVLRAFDLEQTRRFFEDNGVTLKLEETGKYFPVTDSSRTVLNALLRQVELAGAELKTEQIVQQIKRDENRNCWTIRTQNAVYHGASVILCTGGLALPKSGSNGAGYQFASKFHHTIIPTTPALSPLLARPAPVNLSGITMPAQLSLRVKPLASTLKADAARKNETLQEIAAQYDGSFLFTHFGYSGPVALNISRHVAREKRASMVTARWLPQIMSDEERRFWHEFVGAHAKKSAANALAELLPRRVAEHLVQQAAAQNGTLGKLSTSRHEALRRALFEDALPVNGVADYVKAEATAGGVSLNEIEPATMMSKLQDGLFFAGEICDVDGWLGGYNFQWAWSSGTVAGRAAARFAQK